jgi:hypothetical protein
MDIFDKFFKKFAYKFNKGYPDMNNSQDVLLLESLFEKLGVEIPLNEEVPNKSQTTKAVQKIVDQVGDKYNLFAMKSKPNRIGSIGKQPESVFVQAFKDTFGEDIDIKVFPPRQGSNPSGTFNMYQFDTKEFGQVNILVSRSEPGGAGKSNEAIFIDTLNKLIEEAGGTATIKITSPEYTEVSNNVTHVRDSSKAGASKGDKSDAQFLSGQPGSDTGKVVANISLKQDGGFRWASVASNFPDFIKTFQTKAIAGEIPGLELRPNPEVPGRYLMYGSETGERLGKIVIPDFIEGDEQANTFIFGPEEPKVIIVGRTWKESDFSLNGDTITVQASHIYKTLEDVVDAGIAPVFTIAQHQNKPIGLDYRIYPTNMAKIGPKASGLELSVKVVI